MSTGADAETTGAVAVEVEASVTAGAGFCSRHEEQPPDARTSAMAACRTTDSYHERNSRAGGTLRSWSERERSPWSSSRSASREGRDAAASTIRKGART